MARREWSCLVKSRLMESSERLGMARSGPSRESSIMSKVRQWEKDILGGTTRRSAFGEWEMKI
jgi:hypothetical protein